MNDPLPKLRLDLDMMPSPVPDQPGLLVRDPFQYSDAILILPPVMVGGLAFFNGQQTELDLRAHFARTAGQIVTERIARELIEALGTNGFLQNSEFERRKENRQKEFAAAAERDPVHAGSAYPAGAEEFRTWLEAFLGSEDGESRRPLIGIAAPHVSPEGGRRSYETAYRGLGNQAAGRTVVILGTSHFGPPERFGLTRKPFGTPEGPLQVDQVLVEELAGESGDAVLMEDYCHAIEHSIEFQCLFLRRFLEDDGDPPRILPILCGPFARALMKGERPESDPSVARFFAALRGLAERHGPRLFWVLGVDLAHIGVRYGDSGAVQAEQGRMQDVRHLDQQRLDLLCAGDSEGFIENACRDQDPLRWCGLAPLYTFLKAVPGARGDLWRYEQWNIDPQSVVSFGALGFHEAS